MDAQWQDSRIPKVAMRWTSTEKRKKGRLKITWKKTVPKELEELGQTRGEAYAKVQDRVELQRFIKA